MNAPILIAAIATLLRLGLSFSYHQNTYDWGSVRGQALASEVDYLKTGIMELTDSQQYLRLGRSILARGAYGWDGRQSTFRPPGYPLLIALCGASVPVLLVVQALLGGLTVFLAGLLALRWFGRAAGIAAAALCAIDIPSLFYSGLVMSEALFAALVLAALAAFMLRRCTWSGLALGFAALVRPVGLVLFVPFVVALLCRREWKRAVLFALLFALLPVAWVARNAVLFHRRAFTSNGAFNLLYADAAALKAEREGIPRDSARTLVAARYGAPYRGSNPLELAGQLEHAALGIISRQPVRYAVLVVRGIGWTMLGTKSDELVAQLTSGSTSGAAASIGTRLRSGGGAERLTVLGLSAIEILMTLGALALALLGLLRRRVRRHTLLPLAVAACLVLAVGPFTDGRFRVPVMPLIYLSAAAVFVHRRTP